MLFFQLTCIGEEFAMALSKDDTYLIFASERHHIKLYDFKERRLIHIFKNAHTGINKTPLNLLYLPSPSERINSLCISHDNRFIYSVSDDKTLRKFDIENLEEVKSYRKEVHTGT